MRKSIIPLLFFGVVCGIASSVYLAAFQLLLISVIFVLIIPIFFRSQKRLMLFFLAVIIAAYFTVSMNRPVKREMVSSYAYLALSVTGEVAYSSTNKRGSLFILEADSAQIIKLGEVQVGGLFFLFSKATNQYPIGTGLQVVGSLVDFKGKGGNPLDSIKAAMFQPQSVKVKYPPSLAENFLDSIRLRIKSLFSLAGQETGAFLAAILLGDKKSLPSELQKKLRLAGVAHLFVVSGFHVAIISWVLYKLFFLLGLSRKRVSYLFFIFLPFYGLLCGFSLSISRAIMVIFYYILADNGQRRGSVWQALFVAGLVTLIVKPASLFNPGFLLSYGATTGILLFYKDLFRWLRVLKVPVFIASPFAVSLAAQITIIPILLLFFGRVNILSPVINLLVLPLFLVLLMLTIGFVIVSLFFNFSAVSSFLDMIVTVFFSFVSFWAKLSFSQFELNSISLLMVILYYLFIVSLIKGGKIFDRITSNRRDSLSKEITAIFTEERTPT